MSNKIVIIGDDEYEIEDETGLVKLNGILIGRIRNIQPQGEWGTAPVEIGLQHPGNKSIN